jgi:hypothetical protein
VSKEWKKRGSGNGEGVKKERRRERKGKEIRGGCSMEFRKGKEKESLNGRNKKRDHENEVVNSQF